MNQKGFSGIADRHVLALAVHGDADRHVQIGLPVHVHVADAIGMAEHRNVGVVHDVPDKGVAAAGDDQVDRRVETQHAGTSARVSRRASHPSGMPARLAAGDKIGQDPVGLGRFTAAF